MPDAPERNRRRDDTRLARVEANQADMTGTLGRIEGKLNQLNGTLTDVVVELGGVPDSLGRDPRRESIRHRLHALEDTKHAALAVNAALGLLFGRTAKFVLIGCGIASAIFSALRVFGVGG